MCVCLGQTNKNTGKKKLEYFWNNKKKKQRKFSFLGFLSSNAGEGKPRLSPDTLGCPNGGKTRDFSFTLRLLSDAAVGTQDLSHAKQTLRYETLQGGLKTGSLVDVYTWTFKRSLVGQRFCLGGRKQVFAATDWKEGRWKEKQRKCSAAPPTIAAFRGLRQENHSKGKASLQL